MRLIVYKASATLIYLVTSIRVGGGLLVIRYINLHIGVDIDVIEYSVHGSKRRHVGGILSYIDIRRACQRLRVELCNS